MTPLGKKLAGDKPAPAAKSCLAVVIDRGPRGELVELPILGRAWVQLVGHEATQQVEADTFRRMQERGLELSGVTALSYESERAVLTLARSVRSPEDRDAPFGSVDEWSQIDSHLVAACWTVYGDVVDRLAPLDADLPQEHRAQILGAILKKNGPLLRSFGVTALATYLVTTESPPATSPTTRSSDGDSSSES